MKITLNGEITKVIDPNHQPRKIEVFNPQSINFNGENITPIHQPTELGESLKHLNDDSIEPETRMSGIDLRSNIHLSERSPLLAIDTCVALGVLPKNCLMFTRQFKRIAVSVNALGRTNIVDVVSGKQEQDAKKNGGSLIDRIGSVFKPNG